MPHNVFLFDLDGVITNTMPFHFESWKTVIAREGLEISEYDVFAREGQKGAESVQGIFADHGRDLPWEDALRILADKEVLFQSIVKTQYIEGSLDLLAFLHAAKHRMALVTGTARHELVKYVPQHVLNHFEVIVTATEVKNGKPHPEPYLKAMEAMKVRPEHSIVIENAPLGIASAKASGATCLAIETSLPRKYLHQADFVFSSIRELRSVVFSENSKILLRNCSHDSKKDSCCL